MTFNHLPYFKNEDFNYCEYAKAAALRTPIRDAVNTARSMSPAKMAQVIDVLETALDHIRQGAPYVEEPKHTVIYDSSDPLDSLLGPAEAEPDTCIGG